MLAQLEHPPVIDAFALEYAARVMQRVGENVDLGVAPIDERAVEPDFSVQLIEIGHVTSRVSCVP